MSTIQINDFTVTRGTFHLKPVSLTIRNGEIFVLLGQTGSGKTVLLEAISGMFHGDSGNILYDGTDITRISPEMRKIGLVYQNHALFPPYEGMGKYCLWFKNARRIQRRTAANC